MNNWLNKVLDVGRIAEGRKMKLGFIATPSLPEIAAITAACGCTNPSYDPKLRVLNVLFKAGKIPNQVQGNEQPFNKLITVVYKDNTTDQLYIKGIKIKS